jgi:hypothetical protein
MAIKRFKLETASPASFKRLLKAVGENFGAGAWKARPEGGFQAACRPNAVTRTQMTRDMRVAVREANYKPQAATLFPDEDDVYWVYPKSETEEMSTEIFFEQDGVGGLNIVVKT